MESSSGVFGEECQSSESGWTMYICSSIHGDSSHDDHHSGYEDGNGNGIVGKGYNDESDDSMASDASSGPSNQGIGDNLKNKEGCKSKKGRTGKQETERRPDQHEKDQERGKFMVRRGNVASSGQNGLKTRKSLCGWRK